MFSQSSIDSMSIQDLIATIKSMANEVENRIDFDPSDARDYCNSVIMLSENLRDRIEDYLETFEEE